jgi:hypothetical protein
MTTLSIWLRSSSTKVSSVAERIGILESMAPIFGAFFIDELLCHRRGFFTGVRAGRHGRGFARITTVNEIAATWQANDDYRQGDLRAAVEAKLQKNENAAHGDQKMIDAIRQQFDVSNARVAQLERRTRRLLLRHWGRVGSTIPDRCRAPRSWGSLKRDNVRPSERAPASINP